MNARTRTAEIVTASSTRRLAPMLAIACALFVGIGVGTRTATGPARAATAGGEAVSGEASGEAGAFDPARWRTIDPGNLLLMELENGRVAIELMPAFAPRSVAQIRRLVREGFYDGLSFYRVIENFVAQGGIGEGSPAHRKVPTLPAEFTFAAETAHPFTQVQKPETWAPESGFWRGFAVGRDPATGRAWAIHCPGVFALARDADPDTSSSEFYIPIGEAPRHLDRNLTVLGRVVAGLRFIQAAPRGDREVDHGVIPPDRPRLKIRRARIAADLPAHERPVFHVMRTDTAEFRARIEAQRQRDDPFWVVRPRPRLDICTVPVPVRPIW